MIKKCLVNIGVPLGFILSLIVFLLYSNVVLNGVICNSVIYGYMINLSSNFAQTCDLRQQLKLASRLQFDLQDTVDWNRKWLVDFSAWKTQLFQLILTITALLLMPKRISLCLMKDNLLGC